jgi:hypothetical protein
MKIKALSIAIVSATTLGGAWFLTAPSAASTPAIVESVSTCLQPCKALTPGLQPTTTSTTAKAKPVSVKAHRVTKTAQKATTTTSQVPPKLTPEQEAKIQAGENQSGYDYCQATGQPQGCKLPEHLGMADPLDGTDSDQ